MDFSASMHDATMAGLTGMMVTGTVGQRDVFLDQIKQLGAIRDLRVLRGDAVVKLFGPGLATDDHKPDALEQQVLQSGKAVIQVDADAKGEYLRAVRPTLASKNSLGKDCTTCHLAPEGAVLGVVSMKVSLDKVNASLADQRIKSILAALITCIPVLALIYPFIRRVVTRPLDGCIAVARSIASGDLTRQVEVTSRNEMGELQQALHNMNQSLRTIVQRVRDGTDAIHSTSGDIAKGNLDLSNRTEMQASALIKTAQSIETLTAAVDQNAAHAQRASQMAQSASEVAQRGGEVVTGVIDTMSSINASSQRIVDIIGVIDSIAFQTNILALNAAVEAARAGEQGRGFAVVASEVRNLAKRSADAAQEIKALISDSVSRVDAGSQQVLKAGQTMNDIVQSIQAVTDIIREISSASASQSAGIAEVSTAMNEMNGVTQQNAALVEEAAAAARSLKDQASRLESLVQTFKLEVQPPRPTTT
ncbi:MAG: hypothetical protein OHK0048_13310 [Rhodoferax sp.]